MKLLLIAEHDNKEMKPVNLHTLQAASQLTEDIDILLIGSQLDQVIAEVKKFPHVKKIRVVSDLSRVHSGE